MCGKHLATAEYVCSERAASWNVPNCHMANTLWLRFKENNAI